MTSLESLKTPFVYTFIAKGVTSVGALLMVIIVGQIYGPTGVGVLAVLQGLILGGAILASYGMDQNLLRYIGRDRYSFKVLRFLRWALYIVILLSALTTGLLYSLKEHVDSLFEVEGLSAVLSVAAFAVPAASLSLLLSGFLKAIRKPVLATYLEGGGVAVLVSVLVLLANHLEVLSGIYDLGWVFSISTWTVLLIGITLVVRWRLVDGRKLKKSESKDSTKLDFKGFLVSASSYFLMNLANFIHSTLSVLIAGTMLTGSDLGLFKASQQTAMVIGFILVVMNSILPPRFASLYYQGDLSGLGKLAAYGAKKGLLFSSPIFFICFFFPGQILSLFGEGFEDGSRILQILALAQLVNVATGSVGFMLNMTGHEKIMRNIVWVTSSFGILFLYIFTPKFGVYGAALSISAMIVFQNLVALIYVWKEIGVWVLPCTNFLLLLGVTSNHNAK